MKKLILILLSLNTLVFGLSADKLNGVMLDAQREAVKQIMVESNLVIVPKDEPLPTSENIFINSFSVPTSCESYTDLTCPTPKEKYLVRRGNVELQTGRVNCYVYSYENLDRPILNYAYINPTCKERWQARGEDANVSEHLQNVVNNVTAETQELENVRTAAHTRIQGINETQLNLSDLLIAVMTMDGEKIDIFTSVAQGKIKLNSGFTALTENVEGNSHLSDLAQEALTSKIVALFEFMAKANDTIETMLFIFILFFILGFVLKSGILIRMFDKNEVEGKKSDAIMWTGGMVAAAVFFLFPSVSINFDQYGVRLNQSGFHKTIQFVFSEAAHQANKINIAMHDATFSTLLKERGQLNTAQVYQAAAENEKLEQVVNLARAEYNRCLTIFDKDHILADIGEINGYLFPLTETELIKRITEVSPDGKLVYSPYYSGLLTQNAMQDYLNIGVTMSSCGQAEREYREAQKKIAQNLEYLSSGNNFNAMLSRQNVKKVMERSYKTVEDWGFLSAAFLPVAISTLATENSFDPAKQEKSEKDFVQNFTYNMPYLILPGSAQIIQLMDKMADSVSGGIPILNQIVRGSTMVASASLTIEVAKYVIAVAPYMLIGILGMIIMSVLLFQIAGYFLAAYFAFLLALWNNSLDSMAGFLGRGVRLVAKIVAFPASIFFALEANWIMTSIATYLGKTYADNMDQEYIATLGYQLFGGFLNLAMVFAAIFLTFKITATFIEIILENLAFKSQDTLDNAVEQISQQTTRGMKGH